jgi:hypothetical protein
MVGILKKKVKGSVRKEPIKYRWLALFTFLQGGVRGIEFKALPGPEITPLTELPGSKLGFPRGRES